MTDYSVLCFAGTLSYARRQLEIMHVLILRNAVMHNRETA